MLSIVILFALFLTVVHSFSYSLHSNSVIRTKTLTNEKMAVMQRCRKQIQPMQMNFFEDAFRFLSNMKKEASAKHILIKGPEASKKLQILKDELASATDVSAAFSELASKVKLFIFLC